MIFKLTLRLALCYAMVLLVILDLENVGCDVFLSPFQLAYTLFGVLAGPLLGIFTLGMLFPWANKWVRIA